MKCPSKALAALFDADQEAAAYVITAHIKLS